MPSPFPGMDPFVESPLCWPSLHYRLPGLIADHLQPQLAPRYVAVAEERVYLEEPERELVPDVSIRGLEEPGTGREAVAVAGPHSLAATALPLWIEGA